MWWRGIPSSSTHALVGGLAGAGLASPPCWAADAVGRRGRIAPFQVVAAAAALPADRLSRRLTCWSGPPPGRPATPSPTSSTPVPPQARPLLPAPWPSATACRTASATSAVLMLALLAARLCRRRHHAGRGWRCSPAVLLTAGTLFGGWRISLHHRLPADPDRSAARLRRADLQLGDAARRRDRAALAGLHHPHGDGGRAGRRREPAASRSPTGSW